MIRMIQVSNSDNAKAYFKDALSRSDYYLDDQERQGVFMGKLSGRLGITGPTDKKTFEALCDNIDPTTGESLTPRFRGNRIVGYDVNFHCPKSLSIIHGFSKDDHILEAFEDAVAETMAEIEQDAQTRVRSNNRNEDRDTSELIWAKFTHQTARPVEAMPPDPHLHAHCFLFNATWDEIEGRIKAGRFRNIKRDMPYYQAKFHKKLADKMIQLGYEVRRTRKSFEIEGVPKRVIDHFSKRTNEIGHIAKTKGITDPDELDKLGARTRAKKQKGMTMSALKSEWRKQIRELGPEPNGEGDRAVRFAPEKEKVPITARQCVDQAVLNGFERASVVKDRRLLAEAYRHSIGDVSTTIEAIDETFRDDLRIIQVPDEGENLCTTHDILAEERYMVRLARQGRGKLLPLYNEVPPLNLDGQQASAIKHVLTSPHRVSIIRGAAGTGKTTLMKEAIGLMEQAGKTVTVVAPTAQASRGVLREEGFGKAQTVSKLFEDREMQESLKDQVLWVDEAGLLGTKDMTALLELATKKNARLILGGDTRQHSSVLRGDALRILNTVANIKSAEVSKIYRQQEPVYKQTVEFLSQGRIKEAFVNLEDMGAIVSIDPLKPNERLVEDYLDSKKQGRTALIISPTHEQGEIVTEEIRRKLKEAGLINQEEYKVRRLNNLNLTEAQKADWRNIEKGNVIQFNQNTIGIRRGSVWKVSESNEKFVILADDAGMMVGLPMSRSKDYDVFHDTEMNIAKGDTVRITRNGIDRTKNRLNNGQLFEVAAVNEHGDIELKNPTTGDQYHIPQEFGHLSHAHCITSHASQGKTVDDVFISQPASTFGATNAKQMYVSVSRGRHTARIYTEDKDELMKQASRAGDRESAIELVRKSEFNKNVEHNIRNEMARMSREPMITAKEPILQPSHIRDRHHEPGL